MRNDKYIYIIDDNDEYSLYLKKLLENNGYNCILFKDPTEFFYELEIKIIKPDVILIDLSMPEINGLDIIKYLNSSKTLKKLKKVIVSAKTDLMTRDEFKDITFLSKPINEDNFINKIDNMTLIKRENIKIIEESSRECQIFCFLESSSFYSKIVITKMFPSKVEFLSDIKFHFGAELKFHSRSFFDITGVSCDFKIKINQIKKRDEKYICDGELIFENKNDYEKISNFINAKNIGVAS
ncbi:response regulator [Pigmentibacter sp. JX0631]|uniref:response regulator n=1 Tax=Pigmentibacter sp. JX0631 TaxID=2976982 RepID=UPI00246890B8|nr:response regulator [Pigmentibacter sp. JX0631]WGL61458.1 response regulator [Pigmentibacter sp. JX0631]